MNTKSRQHFPIGQEPVHITYRLYGSIPKVHQQRLQSQREFERSEAKREALNLPPRIGGQLLLKREFEINARYELAFDEYLHNDSNGPYHLSRPDLAAEISLFV